MAEIAHLDPTGWIDSAEEFLIQVKSREIATCVIATRLKDGSLQYRIFDAEGDSLTVIGLLKVTESRLVDDVIYEDDEG